MNSGVGDLQLLHLADSALPIGSLAHSFGIESLVSEGILAVGGLSEFFRGVLEEAGMVDAVFCRAAFRLASAGPDNFSPARWLELNGRLSALKPAREARAGSTALGHNFLNAVLALGDFPLLRGALAAAKGSPGRMIHHAAAFGLASGVLGFGEDRAVLAYLHQSMASLVSACQRLLPLGQTEATRILWNLKPAMLETAARSAACDPDDACCFVPLLDWGAMEHPALSTRLFVS
jgi:urease accessory protein